jgi:histone H3/H4
LAGNDAALGRAEACPHAYAVDEIVCAGVCGAEGLVFEGAPVGDEAPLHGVEDDIRAVGAAENGGIGAWGDVVPGIKGVLVVPDVDVELLADVVSVETEGKATTHGAWEKGVLLSTRTMETAATKLVHAASVKTLHAYSFSRSSSTAALTLADLLARYLALLSESCAKYAHHAGRTNLSVYDAVAVLDELGIGVDELADFCSYEARELNRYASNSARRIEDLNDFRGALSLSPLARVISLSFSATVYRSKARTRRRDPPRIPPLRNRGRRRRRRRGRERGCRHGTTTLSKDPTSYALHTAASPFSHLKSFISFPQTPPNCRLETSAPHTHLPSSFPYHRTPSKQGPFAP